MERLDRLTQYRLLESVPDGPYWQPGALSLVAGPRFRLLEAYEEPYDQDSADFSWDDEKQSAPPPRALRTAPAQPQPHHQPRQAQHQPQQIQHQQAPVTSRQKKQSWGRKAWNATKYVAGLVSKTTENASPLGQSKMIGQALGWNDKTPWIDKAQDVVSLVGIVDPTGIADVSNAIVYGARGKKTEAAISLAGAVAPYAGDIAKLKMFARGTAKAAQEGKVVARTAHVGAAAAKVDAQTLKAARDASKAPRAERLLTAKAGRKVGRQGRTLYKAATGKGTLRGTAGRVDAEMGRRFGGRWEQGKKSLRADFKDKAQGAFDAVKDAVSQKPEPNPPKAAEPQEVPPPKPEGRLARKTVDDEKPAQPTPEPEPEAEPAQAAGRPTAGETSKPAEVAKSGGAAKTPRSGKSLVPVDSKCPPPDTKTSKFGAKEGFKRCHPQTPGRKH